MRSDDRELKIYNSLRTVFGFQTFRPNQEFIPNLFYRVERESAVNQQILGFLKEHAKESGIIYRTTRDSVMETADFLVSRGISALPYHAVLTPDERTKNQEAFNRDEVEVVVATIIEHLERLLQDGRAMDINHLVNPVNRDIIEKLVLAYQQWNLTPVVEQSKGTVSYEEARLVRAFLIGQTNSRS